MKYSCINIQGNLISEEILHKIEKAEAQGQKAQDFGFEPTTNIRSEIEYAWSRIKLDWKNFNDKSQNLQASDPYGTTLSRKWMEQFMSSIGFELSRPKTSLQGDNNQSYNISHVAENMDNLPIHLVGFTEPNHPDKNTLDIKTSGGTSRFSPHGTLQEYLNVTEHLYGIAANGYVLRLIRDSGRLIKLSFVEFDLKRMMEEDKYSEFTLLYRLIHASRFPRTTAEAEHSLLEKYYKDSIETGNRIRDGLSRAVKESLLALGKGFLQHENNTELREKIQSGALSPKDYYRQLLRIIYRFLFLMVTEERDLIYDQEDKSDTTQRLKKIYFKFYSIARLRKLSESRYVYEAQFNDLWQGLVNTFLLFEAGGNGKTLGILPLDGDLFSYDAIADLQNSLINNKLLLECVRNLNEFTDDGKNLVPINYRSLDVEELGSVYEGLLELHPVIDINQLSASPLGGGWEGVFVFHEGTDRKTTGSYYTRPDLVNELIKSALIPVIEERLKEATTSAQGSKHEIKEAQAKALLKLKVCDAAAGSGHMLLAAARTIAWYLARVQSGEENPAPSVYRKCLREVIQHCIYAVDFNPDAVELCKLALWLEGHNSGKPLSFLDHKIRNGNSLVGVTDLKVLEEPIPDDAFNPVTGDDKDVCRELKKRNVLFSKTRQIDLFSAQGQQIKQDKKLLKDTYTEMELIEQDTVEAVQEVKKRFSKVRNSVYHEEKACHIWTAAFFKTYTAIDDPTNPSSEKLSQYFDAPTQYGRLVGDATALAEKHKFFHWPLEFPDVFEQGGFDVMLGNPPWERVKLSEQEFFTSYDSEITKAINKSVRDSLIKKLPDSNPILYKEYKNALHSADCQSKFLRYSQRYPLTAMGDINTYAIFSELFLNRINHFGRSGIIVPTGISTDKTTSTFFGYIVEKSLLFSIYDINNAIGFFPDVDSNMRFTLLTLGTNKSESMSFSFFCKHINDIYNPLKRFELTMEDFVRLNPNTKSCPSFITSIDANISKKIYQTNSILIDKINIVNPWKVEMTSMFHLSNDSGLFSKLKTIENVSLYEAKMVQIYNHRFADTSDPEAGMMTRGKSDKLSEIELSNPLRRLSSRYFVNNEIVKNKVKNDKKWFFVFRDTTGVVSNERTAIFSIIPLSGVANSAPIMNINYEETIKIPILIGNLSSIVFDFFARQKVGGLHMNFFIVEQLPIIHPDKIDMGILKYIIPKIFELTYTSWDIKSFADDVWKEANADLRVAISKQWEANKAATGGHEWQPPEWCEIDEEGCPLPPFKWDEDRRAVLKAELDAIYAKLYGLNTEELRYILDPQDVYGPDFPGETFRVLKDKEIKKYGEYRTRRLVLEAWGKLN